MSGVPRRIFAIASLPRTGSSLLTRALWDTGRCGAPSEYLNPMQIRDWEVRFGRTRAIHQLIRGPLLALVGHGWSERRLVAHLDLVTSRRTGPEGWFGLKIHRHHLERWFPDDRPEARLGPIRWIRVTRKDEVAQAVSWARALQTGQWAAHQRPWMAPRYSRRAIEGRRRAIRRGSIGWDDFFRAREQPLALTYEEIAADLTGSVRKVLTFLDVDDGGVEVGAPMRRQADPVSAEWIRRFSGLL
jgi:LPS sulfotransferase NodH